MCIQSLDNLSALLNKCSPDNRVLLLTNIAHLDISSVAQTNNPACSTICAISNPTTRRPYNCPCWRCLACDIVKCKCKMIINWRPGWLLSAIEWHDHPAWGHQSIDGCGGWWWNKQYNQQFMMDRHSRIHIRQTMNCCCSVSMSNSSSWRMNRVKDKSITPLR